MNPRRSAGLVSLVTALGVVGAVGVAPAESAERAAPGVDLVTKKLDGPFGLQKAVDHRGFVVAENVSGQVTRVFKDGRQRVIVRRAAGVSGVATDSSHVYAVLGGPNEDGPPAGGAYAPSSVLRTDYQGHGTKVIADLLKHELAHNPDGQVQFVDGEPVDALSNPFSMTMTPWGLLVADGGANDVLKVNPRTGRVSTFFAPPTVKDVKACQAPDANANPGTVGCDPVPTGVDVVNGQRLREHARRRGAGSRARLQADTAGQGPARLEGADVTHRRRGPARRHHLRLPGPAGIAPGPAAGRVRPVDRRPDHQDQRPEAHPGPGHDADRARPEER